MCGITGILRWQGEPPQRDEIAAMTNALAHRGPDGEGMMLKDRIALGHRRLAIIDLETGQQPMCNEDKQVWITYNGEIYNYRELREILQSMGHVFATRSDTEVIVHAYEQWGTSCLEKLRGMFAFVIADLRQRRLFLARDHFGIKPLYYRISSNYIAFSSELNALRQINDADPDGDLQSVDLYLRFQYIPTPHTIYKNVYKLPPASYMIVNWKGEWQGPVRYWDLHFEPKERSNELDCFYEASEVIAESVRAHLVSDVPFGVFLSGGIDSTLVTLEMCRALNSDVRAFAIGFSEEEFSELRYAKFAADKMGISLQSEIVDEIDLELLPQLVEHYGEPFGDNSIIPTWYVSRLARSHVPMVLSGDGGDEGFGGYDSYQRWMTFNPWIHLLHMIAGLHPRAAIRAFRDLVKSVIPNGAIYKLSQWQKHIEYVPLALRLKLWNEEFAFLTSTKSELFRTAARKAQGYDRLSFVQYLDFQTYLPCDILTKVDVASMFHGLEVRTPLIDRKVVELLTKLTPPIKFRKDPKADPIGKYILKKLLEPRFGPEFTYRKKQGFVVPRQKWFLPQRKGREMLLQLLHDQSIECSRWFNKVFIDKALESHSSDCDNSGLLWLLLVLCLWLDQNRSICFK